MYLVTKHGFEAAAEVLKMAALFVHLYSLSVVLDLCVHTTGALSHSHANGTTCLSLKQEVETRAAHLVNVVAMSNQLPLAALCSSVSLTSMGLIGVMMVARMLSFFLMPVVATLGWSGHRALSTTSLRSCDAWKAAYAFGSRASKL